MSMNWEAGRIVDKAGALVAPILTTGYSYNVLGIAYTTKAGQRRAIWGCRDCLEAFRVAKQYARKSGRDVKGWRLQYTDHPAA